MNSVIIVIETMELMLVFNKTQDWKMKIGFSVKSDRIRFEF